MSGEGRQVWLVRHGETEWSRTLRHTGRTDVALTAFGEGQARALAAALAGHAFARVLTSPLRRAADTCALAGFGPVARPAEDLVEWDYGAYEGRTTEEIRREAPGWTVWSGPVPEGEPIAAVAARADRVIAELAAADGDVLVFGHGHQLRVLAARWLGLAPEVGRLLVLDAAARSVLGHEHGARVLLAWNLAAPAAGIPEGLGE